MGQNGTVDEFDRPDEPDDPMDVLRRLLRDLGMPEDADVNDAEVRADLFRTMMRRMMPTDGVSDTTVVWETTRLTARRLVSSLGADPAGSSRASRQVSDAVHLAELWLSDATVLPPIPMAPVVWSRAEWIEATLPAWKSMIEPVVTILSGAVSEATQSRMDEAAEGELADFQSALHPFMSRAVAAMFGAHLGEGLGRAAMATLTGTDLGLPLLGRPDVGVLPTNITAVHQQTELDDEGLLLYCSVREVARQRLFAEIGWITPQIIALVQHYAREMRVDPEGIASAMEAAVPDHLSPETVMAFQTDFSSILFTPELTKEQTEILARLSTLLALVEGWVEDVTQMVAGRWLPEWEAISESLRRHHATARPLDVTVTPLIGLSASPRSIRESTAFWRAVRAERGVEGRDDIWRHPDSMPQNADIADPAAYLAGEAPAEDDWDNELRRLLGSED